MAKKKQDESYIVRSSTTHMMPNGERTVTITQNHDDGDGDLEPITVTVEPMPNALSEWLEVGEFLQGVAAELLEDGDESEE